MVKMRSAFAVLVIIGATLFGLNIAYSIDNLLMNGSFEDGTPEPWVTYGTAEIEVDDTDAIEGKYALRVAVTEAGVNFWDVGLQHDPGNHTLEEGKVYTLSAFLKSDAELEINFKPELSVDPWTGYGEQQFLMTTEWQELHITTAAMPETAQPASITFHIGFGVGTFMVDAVQLYEGEYVPTVIGQPTAVEGKNKLATTWAQLKAGK